MVRHIRPKTLSDALAFLADDPFCLMAGGTDVMVQKRSMAGIEPDFGKDVLYIRDLPELRGIHHDGTSVRIGAAEPLENILDDPDVPKLLRLAEIRLSPSMSLTHASSSHHGTESVRFRSDTSSPVSERP